MNVVAPFGFYGWGNIGDESTLQGFARLISCYHSRMHVWVASRDPLHTTRVEPSFKYYKAVGRDLRRRWARYRSSAYVVPGGTPIMDVLGAWPLSEVAPLVQAAHAQQKPIVFVGTGTERLRRKESKFIISQVLAPRVLHWSVRSARDRDRLVEYGVPAEKITEAADLAWTLDAVLADFGENCLQELGLDLSDPLVGVNINNEQHMTAQEPLFFEKLAKCLDTLIEKHHVRIVFFCNEIREGESFDKAASQNVLVSMKHRDKALLVPNHYWSPQQMLSLIACCRVVISTRYHFCLFSALQNVPFIALKRSDKVKDLCWDMNWPYGVPLKNLNDSTLLDMFSDIEQMRLSLCESLQQQTEKMQKRALKNKMALDALIQQIEK